MYFEHTKDCLTAKAQALVAQRTRSEVVTIGRLWEIIETIALEEIANIPHKGHVTCYFCGGLETTGEE